MSENKLITCQAYFSLLLRSDVMPKKGGWSNGLRESMEENKCKHLHIQFTTDSKILSYQILLADVQSRATGVAKLFSPTELSANAADFSANDPAQIFLWHLGFITSRGI